MTPERKAILAHLLVDPRYDVMPATMISDMLPEVYSMKAAMLTHNELHRVAYVLVPETSKIEALMRDERIMLFVQYATNTELGSLPWI